MTIRRTKEISIRKVHGATVAQILILIIKESVGLVILANVLTWPLAYFIMNRWLANFPYKMTLYSGIFMMSAFITLLITILTISYQSTKTALTNPVDALKHE